MGLINPWFRKIPWRSKWQPVPVFLSGETHGQRNLVEYIQSMGSQRVGHNWVTEHTYTHTLSRHLILILLRIPHKQRRQWHPTPVLLPGKSHGWRSLVGCSPWGHWGSDTTEQTSLSLFTFMHWRRKWQPTPVFLPGESQGWGSLVGCRLWGHTELDMTEVT